MADIAMCRNGCERQATCYRWTAPTNPHWQATGNFKPDEHGVCKHYWPNEYRAAMKQEGE